MEAKDEKEIFKDEKLDKLRKGAPKNVSVLLFTPIAQGNEYEREGSITKIYQFYN